VIEVMKKSPQKMYLRDADRLSCHPARTTDYFG
jgi:hypothetical protein